MDQEALEKVLYDDIRSMLAIHGGDVQLVRWDAETQELYLRLSGACADCPSANLSTKAFIEDKLSAVFPEIRGVQLVQAVTQDLVDLARKLLNHQPLPPSRAIKFCGGCNPKYNREAAALQLKERLGEALTYAQNGKSYDELYVICGCAARCADISRIQAGRVIIIDSAELPEWIGNDGKHTEKQGE